VGNVPTSPLSLVGPVFVMPPPARTTKLLAVPSGTGTAAAWALPGSATSIARAATDATPKRIDRFGLEIDNVMVDPFDDWA
jgi:hypothetical protein